MTRILDKYENFDILKNEILKDNLVIFPTETVYGIGANALSEKAVEKIYEVKNRAQNNPLIVHLKDKNEIEKYAFITNDIEKKLIDNFMPGPFTLILKKNNLIPEIVSKGLDTVGIRVPSNAIAEKFLNIVGVPIAAPSANISGKPSGTSVKDIFEEFNGKINYIIDGGDSDVGLESTVVKVIDNVPTILRPGFITYEDIEKLIGACKISPNVLNQNTNIKKVESPGMIYRHYAPKTKCLLVYNENINILKKIIEKNSTNKTIILGSENLKDVKCYKYINYGNTLKEISHNIFRLLRKCDKYNADLIIIEGVKSDGLGLAIMNRLIRTANFNIKKDL